MEFKQLEAFVAVVDYGSFSEAARRLYLTQPTISAHIRSLEDELHMKLIIRTTKKNNDHSQEATSFMTVQSVCWKSEITCLKILQVPTNI
ncbi:MAG: LysR family transcriptional regulator [Ruminococcus sp.]